MLHADLALARLFFSKRDLRRKTILMPTVKVKKKILHLHFYIDFSLPHSLLSLIIDSLIYFHETVCLWSKQVCFLWKEYKKHTYCCILILRHLFDFLSETYNFVSILFFYNSRSIFVLRRGVFRVTNTIFISPQILLTFESLVHSKLSICFPLVEGTAIPKNEVSIFYGSYRLLSEPDGSCELSTQIYAYRTSFSATGVLRTLWSLPMNSQVYSIRLSILAVQLL